MYILSSLYRVALIPQARGTLKKVLQLNKLTTEKICGQKLQIIQHWNILDVKSKSSGIIRLGWNSQVTTQVLWPWSSYLTPLRLSFLKREYKYNPLHHFCEIKGGSLYPPYNRHAVNINSCCSTVAVAATSNTTTTVAAVNYNQQGHTHCPLPCLEIACTSDLSCEMFSS